MALAPLKIHLPFQLTAGQTTSITLEDQFPVNTVFAPILRFYNPSDGVNMRLQVQHILDLGFGDDPLNSGTYTFDIVNETVIPDTLRDVELVQLDNDSTVITQHVVTLENLDATETKIVRLILTGRTEIQAQLPASQQIIKASS